MITIIGVLLILLIIILCTSHKIEGFLNEDAFNIKQNILVTNTRQGFVTMPSFTPIAAGLTFSALIMLPGQDNPAQWSRIFDMGDVSQAPPNALLIGFNYPSNTIICYHSVSGTAKHMVSTTKLALNTLYHVVWTIDADGKQVLYINGQQEVTQTYAINLIAYPYFNLGKSNWIGDPYPNMMLYDFRMMNRALPLSDIIALSTSLATKLYQSPKNLNGVRLLSGQYIVLNRPQVGCFNLAEIQVFSYAGGPNIITPTMAVTLLNPDPNTPSKQFVDGNLDTIAHNNCGAGGPLTVDLGSSRPIYKIIIYNRKDCCWQRANGTVLTIQDSNRTVIYTASPILDKLGRDTYIEDTPQNNNKTDYYSNFTYFPPYAAVAGNSEKMELSIAGACAGLTRDSPASSVSPACLQQTFLEVGCNKLGGIYPSNTYSGWWTQDTGAKTFGGIRDDMNAWATLPDQGHRDGCYGSNAVQKATIPNTIDVAKGWSRIYPHENPPDQFTNETPESCRQRVLNNPEKYSAWGYRMSNHPDANWLNTCYLYKNEFGPYRGDVSDSIHISGCANPGEKLEWGCRIPPKYNGPPDTTGFDFKNDPNTDTKTYDEMKKVCKSKNMEMCSSSDLCDNGVPLATLDVFNDSDNWIAVSDKQNEWFTFNRGGNRLCKTHTQVADVTPAWGSTNVKSNWARAVKCCPSSLGAKGDRGLSGADGIAGPQGPQGVAGPQGERGQQGEKGERGDIGPIGRVGETGNIQTVAGPRGDKGDKGDKGDTGITTMIESRDISIPAPITESHPSQLSIITNKIKQLLSSKRRTTENYENMNALTTSVAQGREYKLNK